MSWRARLVFVVLCIVWGVPYFFIKLAIVELSPFAISWGRNALAAAVLIPLVSNARARDSIWRHRWPICAYAFAEIIVPFSIVPWGERWISSSLTGVLIATLPLTVVLMSPLFGVHERLTARRIAGLLLGFIGVLILLGVDHVSGLFGWIGVGCMLVATIGYAIGGLIVQRYLAAADLLPAVAASLAIAALVLLPPVLLWGAPTRMPSALALGSIVVLGIACTALALWLYFFLIAEAGAARAAVITYVNPAIAALLGVLVLHEHFGLSAILASSTILIGSWLATHRAGGKLELQQRRAATE
jgi:drug/metabolite transporter (DMT)-like permease